MSKLSTYKNGFNVVGTAEPDLISVDIAGDKIGMGTGTPDTLLHVKNNGDVPIISERISSSTNTSLRALEAVRTTTGTAAAGIGIEFGLRVEDSGGSLETAASIAAILNAVPPSAEQGTLQWKIVSDSSLFTFLEAIASTGNDVTMTLNGEFVTTKNIKQQVHTDNVSNPPTDAELDSIFGTPATVGAGFSAYIDDAGGSANFYHVVSDGTAWWIFTGTKAV